MNFYLKFFSMFKKFIHLLHDVCGYSSFIFTAVIVFHDLNIPEVVL